MALLRVVMKWREEYSMNNMESQLKSSKLDVLGSSFVKGVCTVFLFIDNIKIRIKYCLLTINLILLLEL